LSDIIQLLPESVANQIAAGEVIQRPASALKELLENAIDAGASAILVLVKDSGKSLIQVIDNGKGMTGTDARMSFLRHATSKISKADDLFTIRTKGFRGEALASIAAISQVELKTRRAETETGIRIEIEGSEIKSQSSCSCPVGTSVSLKNIFYNVPARRNFLKSDQIEFRHILEEFERVTIPHPEISFSLQHNDQLVYRLEKGTLKNRIVALFGSKINERLVPVEQQTNIISVHGYIGKPEHARKTRGEQFFFINGRFIKSAYLNHAVQSAYNQLLGSDSFPSYFILMDVDPKTIDVNIHPTKTEIKFEDEKSVYAILRSTIKLSLGKYNLTPTLDFEQEMSFANIPLKSDKAFIPQPTIKVNPRYNPFGSDTKTGALSSGKANWEQLYESHKSLPQAGETQVPLIPVTENRNPVPEDHSFYQTHGSYIVSSIKSGLLLVDQQGAHERILFEHYLTAIENGKGASQQMLFPKTIVLTTADFDLVRELMNEIRSLGFDLNEFGKNTFSINGVPADTGDSDGATLLEKLIESFKQNRSELRMETRENLARSLAKNASVKPGKLLNQMEMKDLIDRLFACASPRFSASGKHIIATLTLQDLENLFKKQSA